MTDVVSNKYRLIRNVSANALSQSWLAERVVDNLPCFVKTTNPNSDVPVDEQRNLILNSFACQQGLRSNRFLTARGKLVEGGRLFIEYPLFDSANWTVLTADVLISRHAELLPKLFLLIDFLHFLGYAHCDIKLDNFIVNPENSHPGVRLIDMDFLCTAGSSPHARILGSPDHVAPEIINNDKILARSDNFSLGVMITKAVEEAGYSLDTETRRRLDSLVENLASPDAMHRPRVLVEALLKHGLIDSATHDMLRRELVTLLLINRYREAGAGRIREQSLRKVVLESCRILGLRTELTDNLQAVFRKSRTQALKLFTRIVHQSRIERLGEYWHLSPSGDLLVEVYNACADLLGTHPPIPAAEDLDSSDSAEQAHARARGYFEREEFQIALLIDKTIAQACRDHPNLLPQEQFEKLLYDMSEIAAQMGRRAECRELLEELFSIQSKRDAVNPDYIFMLIRQATGTKPVEEIRRYADVGADAAIKMGLTEEALRLRSLVAIALCQDGKPQEGQDVLDAVAAEARGLNAPRLEVLMFYIRSHIALLHGDAVQAEDFCRKSLEIAKSAALESEMLLATLGMSWALRAQYRLMESAKVAKAALAMEVVKTRERWRVVQVAENLVSCFVKTGDYLKAEYWLNKRWTENTNEPDRKTSALLYQTLTHLNTMRSMLDEAKEAAATTLEFVGRGLTALDQAKTYVLLAEIACYQGNSAQLHSSASEAREIFRRLQNPGSIEELNLIEVMHQTAITGEANPDLYPLAEKLERYGSLWDCGYALYYMIIESREQEVGRFIDSHARIRALIELAEMPVFAALKTLTPVLESGSSADSTLNSLKSAYRIMADASLIFHAMNMSIRIAREYGKNGRNKLALKFFQQALKHAGQLKNDIMKAQLDREIQRLQQSESDRTRVVSSLLGISEILRHIDDYPKSLEQIVRFAVEQTGAERGVLLEKKKQSDELRVRAYVNCDDESLRDITDISMRVPQQVAHQAAPLILENALADKRTKDYRSIVAHNILSVICIPIEHSARVLGVLYLDHHTIPALFDQDDVVYIRSIGNFIGVMMSAIGSYRDIGVINQQLVEEINLQTGTNKFVTEDPDLLGLFARLPEIAHMSMPVLIRGESGTGKEIVCELIHKLSQRSDKPLIKMNCAALPESMIESELFGIVPSAATGVAGRDGKFSAADGGTLFLDEIGDLPLAAQAKILRAVEYQEFEKVGSNKLLKTDIRFIYATNKDLGKMVAQGTFRNDLYHRISGYTFEISPLRERPGDIWPLLEHFVRHFSRGRRAPIFSHNAKRALRAYTWPGNVRELRNTIEHFCILRSGETIELQHLPEPIRSSADDPKNQKKIQEQTERAMLLDALTKFDWNVKRTAEYLHMPYSTLQNKIKKYKLKRPA